MGHHISTSPSQRIAEEKDRFPLMLKGVPNIRPLNPVPRERPVHCGHLSVLVVGADELFNLDG